MKVTQCGYCDRTLTINGDPRHRNEVELHGKWFCNTKCAHEHECRYAESLPLGEELCHTIVHIMNVGER